MKRIAVFLYGVACYAAFFVTFLYAIGFLGNFGVPKSIDSGPEGPAGPAIIIDGALLALFAMQHSVMARPWFKRAWTRLVPEPAERSTYVLASSAALALLFWLWRPIEGDVWNLDGGAAIAVDAIYIFGLLLVLFSTFLINHFDLFGLRQVWLYLQGRPYTHPRFRTPMLYRFVRHPLYVGWLLTFWAAPELSAARLFFAVMTTAYIFVAIRFEEADLITLHGDQYRRYRAQTPMIVPSLRRSGEPSEAAAR
jgi:protein-S-isoprenylcysteine O-methyltransferase Ste14